MTALDEKYPGYGFAGHAGYGVAKHRAAIEQLGVTPEHRLSFAPLQKYAVSSLPAPATDETTTRESLTTRRIGDGSETVAAKELVRLGHEILERNWKTKYCEIDIVSRKGDTVYFTEVKHRKNDKAGDGLAAITPRKLRQMEFAARLYVHAEHLSDTDLRLAAIATTGDPPVVSAFIEVQ